MSDHPDAARYREAMERLAGGDTHAFDEFATDDIVYHQIGAPPIVGREALLESMEAFEGVEWSIDLHDVVANDEHTIGLVEATVKIGDDEITYRTAEILHFVDGKVSERWAFSDDTQAIIDFFAKLAAG